MAITALNSFADVQSFIAQILAQNGEQGGGWPERNKAARSFRQLRRFHRVINSNKVFGTHNGFQSEMARTICGEASTGGFSDRILEREET